MFDGSLAINIMDKFAANGSMALVFRIKFQSISIIRIVVINIKVGFHYFAVMRSTISIIGLCSTYLLRIMTSYVVVFWDGHGQTKLQN